MTQRGTGRIRRELTSEEQARVNGAREQLEKERDEIIELAKRFRSAKQKGGPALEDVLTLLKAERESQGLSLTDVEERTGIAKSNLSRLENDREGNPTIATLQQYADALGKRLVVVLADK